MDINYTALGERLRHFRKSQNLSQSLLSERTNIEPSNISHIERGATKVSLPTLIKLTNALGISVDDVLYDSIEKNMHVSVKEMDDLLQDCSEDELKAILEITKTVKIVLRNHG